MKPAAKRQWLCSGILVLTLALCLAGCAPKYYPPPPPPSPPAHVAPPPQMVRPVFYIKANHLNLRACPGMDCPKISVLDKGEEVEKVGEAEDWFQIRVKRDGRLGWVDSRYLSSTPVTPAPETPPAPPGVVAPPPLPEPMQPPPLPEKPVPPAKPPAVEKPPKPAKPGEEVTPPAKKKPEEAKPARPPKPKPEEEAEPAAKPEKPAKKEPKPAPVEEKPAPPTEPESGKKIRIM